MVLIEGMCRNDDVNLSAGWCHQGKWEIAGQRKYGMRRIDRRSKRDLGLLDKDILEEKLGSENL